MSSDWFQAAAEAVERMCATGWRPRLGRKLPDGVKATLFSFDVEDGGEVWKFSFSVRVGKNWSQGCYRCSPPVLDPLSDESVPLISFASSVASEVLDSLVEDLVARGWWYE